MKSKSFIITLSVVIVLGIIAGVIAYKIHRANVLNQAEALFKRGDYNGVISMFQENISGAEERLLVARSHYRLRHFDQAQDVLSPLLEYGENNPEAIALSGWIWLEKGSYAQAKERFETLLEMEDSQKYQAIAQAGLGGVAYVRSEGVRSKDINEAKAYLTRNITKEYPVPQTYIYLAEVHNLLHEFDQSIETAQKAVDMAPRWGESYVVLGKSYLLDKKYNSAGEAFERALQYGASEEETKYYLAQSQYFQGRLQEALIRLEEIIDLQGEMQRDALEDAARISMILEQHPKALGYFMQAWEIQQNPVTGFQIFEIHTREENNKKAREFLRDLTRRWPFLAEVQLEKGNVLLREEKWEEAYSAFNNVLDYDPQNFWAYYNLGCLAFRKQSRFQMTDFFSVASKSAEEFFPAQINYIISLLASDDLTDARLRIQELSKQYPDHPYIIQAQALERFLSKDYERSLELLDQVLDAQSEQASSWIIRGEIYMRMFEFENARDSYNKALEIDADSLMAQLGLAHSSFRIGEISKAEEIYQRLKENIDSLQIQVKTEIRNGIALILFYENQIAEALNIWDEMKKEGGLAQQMALVNSTLIEAMNPSAMEIESLRSAVSAQEPLPETYYNLALYHDKLGNKHDASNTYEQLISRYPHFLYGLFNLAEHYRKRGRYPDAIALFERARNMNPDWLDALNNEAAVYMKDGQFEEAKELLKDAVNVDENSTMVRYNLSLVALHQNDTQKAKEHLDQLREMGALSNYTKMIEGLLFAGEGKWREAAESFTAAKDQDQKDPYAPLNLGICLVKLERYRQAEEALRLAVDCDPSLSAPHRVLGMLYCRLGLFEEAKTMFEVSLNLEPEQEKVQTLLNQIQGWIRSNGSNP